MKLSIITINYNNAAGLKKTLDSVAIQTATDFEHIIVDGASTDDSVEIIREYADNQAMRLTGYAAIRNRENYKAENNTSTPHRPIASSPHRLIWLSEPDTGIYNAMNKGIKLAKGEYTLMLNSGDYLVDEYVIEKILPLLDGTDIIQGNTISNIDNKKVINRGYAKSDISFIDVYKGNFLHQATFAKLSLFEQYGYFDENYKIGGDTVFFLKTLGLGNATFAYHDIHVAYFEGDGISANYSEYWRKQRNTEDQMYDAILPTRLLKLCREDGYKIEMYNRLSSHWISKKIMTLLLKLLTLLDRNEK